MADDVVRLAGAHRDIARAVGKLCVALRSDTKLPKLPGPPAARVAGHIPYGTGARRIGRAAVADLVDVQAVRPREQLEEVAGNIDLVSVLPEGDETANRGAILGSQLRHAHCRLRSGRRFLGRSATAASDETQRERCRERAHPVMTC